MSGDLQAPMVTERDAATETALSVVVVPFGGAERLEACLHALSSQTIEEHVEVIVPFDDRLEHVGVLSARFRFVNFAHFAGDQTPAALRAHGVHVARGPIVALTEDNCEPASDWCARLVEEHKRQVCAVGGVVERDAGSGVSWAIYLADYGRYRPPVQPGPALFLTDINVSYKRWALALVAEVWKDEFHEPDVNGALLNGGGCLWLSSNVVVHHRRSLTTRAALRDRYEFGRLFGSGRVRGAPLVRRAFFVLLATILPLVIVARPVLRALGGGRGIGTLVRALPALSVAAVAWSLGELLGYLTGQPAASGQLDHNSSRSGI